MAASVQRPRPQDRASGFASLYDRHFGWTWKILAGLGVGVEQREDVAQEIWLTVHRRLHTLRPDASETAWLYAIARRTAALHHRSQGRHERRLLALSALPPASVPTQGDRAEDLEMVERLLANLGSLQREVVLLAHVGGMTGPEIAAVLGVPLNTVYSRLRLAKAAGLHELRGLYRDVTPSEVQRRRCWLAVLPLSPNDMASHPGMGGAPPLCAPRPGWWGTNWGAVATVGLATTVVVGLAIALGIDDADRPADRSIAGVAIDTSGPSAEVESEPAVPANAKLRLRPSQDGPPRHGAAVAAPPLPSIEVPSSRSSVVPGRQASSLPRRDPAIAPARSVARAGNSAAGEPADRGKSSQADVSAVADGNALAPANAVAPASAATDGNALADETRLLAQAWAALRRGAPKDALRYIQRHAVDYPQGVLRDVRVAARVRALCGLHRRDEAVAVAQGFLQRFPGSLPVRQAVEGCQ